MEKTIYAGDTFLAEYYVHIGKPPARGDVVVFQHGETTLVKRIIGLPGDTVEGKDGQIFVNGHLLVEPYVEHEEESMTALDTFGPNLVEPGTVLGDNRNRSLDSRLPEFGTVQTSDVLSKALFTLRSTHGQELKAIH